MLTLATLIENAGEPRMQSRYRDPGHLRELGYTGLVLFETTSVSGVESPDVLAAGPSGRVGPAAGGAGPIGPGDPRHPVDASPSIAGWSSRPRVSAAGGASGVSGGAGVSGGGEVQRWVEQQFESIGRRVREAAAAGLDVYIFYDVLSLPRVLIEADAEQALTCRGKPEMLCPASEAAMERSAAALDAMITRWPQIAGVVLRLGDNDAARFPHLVGNELYLPHCPRCSGMSRADRMLEAIRRFHHLIVERHGRRLIVRAWNVRPGGMHDTPDLAVRIANGLPGRADDDRLVLSFKFTETDFWRYQRWNPASLVVGDRPVIYELQCQREFEGKGGLPDWQVPLWVHGCPEMRGHEEVSGLAAVAGRINLAGLWAWVRGGGWGGPFVSSETWIDANVHAVPHLAQQPDADPAALADQWIERRLGISDHEQAAAIRQVLEHSPEHILKAFYIGPYARSRRNAWHPNGDWIQDDLLDANAAWRMIRKLPDAALDEVVNEQAEAAALLAADRATLYRVLGEGSRGHVEPMVNSLVYGESFYEALRDLLDGLVAYKRLLRSKDDALARRCHRSLLAAQSHWNHHTQRHGGLPGAATAFREASFWELTQRILAELG